MHDFSAGRPRVSVDCKNFLVFMIFLMICGGLTIGAWSDRDERLIMLEYSIVVVSSSLGIRVVVDMFLAMLPKQHCKNGRINRGTDI